MIKVSEHEVQEITFLGILFRSLLDINLKSSFPHNIHNIRIHKEEKNIKEENPEIIEKMEVILEDFDKKSLPVEEQEELTNEETKKIEKELRKLGYI